MATTRSTSRRGQLPAGFTTVKDVLDGQSKVGSRINLAGIVTDFRAPIKTAGKDWKCALRLYDQSIEKQPDASLLLNIFWPEKDMPDARCGDVVIAFAVKVQDYQSSYSLFAHKFTDVHIYEAGKIPKPRADASVARRPCSKSNITRHPNKIENEFVSVLYGTIDKNRIPDESEFEVRKIMSTNINKKFSELKDVRDGVFIDAVVQIVKEPFDLGDKYTLWVSDYTEHSSFYPYGLMGGNYTEREIAKSEWPGPYGKRSMQMTCFEPHASVIRDQDLSAGTWIALRNLQIKLGHNSANLEGYLREDRRAQGIKINITKLDHQNSETARPELKNALRRKRDYENSKKAELKSIIEAAEAGRKRKAQMDLDSKQQAKAPKNSKQKRNESRALKQALFNQQNGLVKDDGEPNNETEDDAPEDVNHQIRCENLNKPATSVSDMLAPIYHELELAIDGGTTKLQLPFINANYRTFARVTDFMPHRLEDFTRAKKKSSEYAALSDNEESESGSESESESLTNALTKSTKTITEWEWRFHLRLEDASPGDEPKKSLWVVVDNQSAQMLLNLDASDLSTDDDNLARLRQKLWLLWGDLEEHKATIENRALRARRSNNASAPPHSDDEDESGKKKPAQVSNRPFGCCIRQYGAAVKEEDVKKADAGSAKRWERMFGLFGTRISEM